jgi:hypothetical protein
MNPPTSGTLHRETGFSVSLSWVSPRRDAPLYIDRHAVCKTFFVLEVDPDWPDRIIYEIV